MQDFRKPLILTIPSNFSRLAQMEPRSPGYPLFRSAPYQLASFASQVFFLGIGDSHCQEWRKGDYGRRGVILRVCAERRLLFVEMRQKGGWRAMFGISVYLICNNSAVNWVA